jgi:hypothetical protein
MAMVKTALFLVGAIAVSACSTPTSPTPDFGADYRVLLEPNPPVLATASLEVTVSYGACASNRGFALKYRMQDMQAELWLRKDTPDESCDMLVSERRSFSLPPIVGDAQTIILLTPNSDPYQLRP